MYLVVASLVISLSIAAFTGHVGETTLGYAAKTVIQKNPGDDSWTPMVIALEKLQESPDAYLYDEVFFKKQYKFQYPTSALLFLDIPQKITKLEWNKPIFPLLNQISWLSLIALITVIYFLLHHSIQTNSAASSNHDHKNKLLTNSFAITLLISIAIIGIFYPTLRAYILGQIQTPLTLLAALALLAWQKQKYGIAGILIGICCGIKPQWVILIFWALLRKQWRMLIFSSVTIAIILATSIALYGMHNAANYFKVLSYLSQHGESYFANQSINGLMHRMLFNGDNLNFTTPFPPYHPIVHAFTLVSSALILAFAVFWKRVKNPSSEDLALMMLALTMASPVAWEHHYGILLPIFAIILPTIMHKKTLGEYTLLYVALAFLLVSQKLDDLTNMLAHTHWNFLQSVLYMGAAMFLYLLYKISHSQTHIKI